jgi:hypothetical protein
VGRARPAYADFVERWQAIRAGALLPEAAEGPSLLWKLNAPMLWNSNFFMTLESMKILRRCWLPDFKFGPGHCAMTLAKTPWYWETVTGNLALLDEWGRTSPFAI